MTEKEILPPSPIQFKIVQHLIDDDDTAYGIAHELDVPWKTVNQNLKKLLMLGIVEKKAGKYSVNRAFADDAFIKHIFENLEAMFKKFENTSLTPEGILYFIQYIISHTELRRRLNGRR